MSENEELLPCRMFVTKEIFKVETAEEAEISVRKFKTNPATVSVKAGCTVNLKQYESARIDIMVSVPCYIEEIEETFQAVKKFVDDKMSVEYSELRKIADSR